MGFRTVVILHDDQAGEWSRDKDLGKKIALGIDWGTQRDLGYGTVVECAHADTQTLAVIDGYQYEPLAYWLWNPIQTRQSMQLALLKDAAAKLGYSVVKKPQKKKVDKS